MCMVFSLICNLQSTVCYCNSIELFYDQVIGLPRIITQVPSSSRIELRIIIYVINAPKLRGENEIPCLFSYPSPITYHLSPLEKQETDLEIWETLATKNGN